MKLVVHRKVIVINMGAYWAQQVVNRELCNVFTSFIYSSLVKKRYKQK